MSEYWLSTDISRVKALNMAPDPHIICLELEPNHALPKSGSVSEVQPGYRVRIRSVFFKGQEYGVRIAGPDHNCKDFQNKNHVNTFYKVLKKNHF